MMLWAITRERKAEVARTQLTSAVQGGDRYSSLEWSAPPVRICLRESLLMRLASSFTRRLPGATTS